MASEQDEVFVVDVERECVEQLRGGRLVDLVMRIDYDVLDRRAVQGHAPIGVWGGGGWRSSFGVGGIFDECGLCVEGPWRPREAEPSVEIARVFEDVFQRRGGLGDGRHGCCGYNQAEVDASRVMPLERMRLRRSARGNEP